MPRAVLMIRLVYDTEDQINIMDLIKSWQEALEAPEYDGLESIEVSGKLMGIRRIDGEYERAKKGHKHHEDKGVGV